MTVDSGVGSHICCAWVKVPSSVAQGHRATVEDVVWKPNSAAELASVGDDRGLLLWDTRAGTAPALRKTDAHGTHDLHTVDWSGLREELLATGALSTLEQYWVNFVTPCIATWPQ